MHARSTVPRARNEPVLTYEPGSEERATLDAEIRRQSGTVVDIPLVIGGEEIRTGTTTKVVVPHRHDHVLAEAHDAREEDVDRAIEAALEARETWARTSFEDRAAIFLKAAELLSGPWRPVVTAATMLGQSKTAYQAEIDAAAELIDFFRFNVQFAEEIYGRQPRSGPGMWNRLEYRPLEGFVYAVSPFNFTAIGGNLSGSPALMGNTVVWKPSTTAMLANYHVMRLFQEAGLPPGVINFIHGDPQMITERVMAHPEFAGVHFTGSTEVFQGFWKTVGDNIARYRSYPRLVGETGGKDFIVAHPSADRSALLTAIVRGAFQYQGQKCSAASRVYVPESVWADLEGELVEATDALAMGDPTDPETYLGAVIHARAFEKISGYIDRARESDDAEIIAGGDYDDSEGWFVRPTVIRADAPDYESMCDEIFGPVVTVHVYPDEEWAETLELVDSTSPYALTGAVFAQDRSAIREALDALWQSAGNFYVNDKPTGAVVGQQPFGGARASGTNDKAGSAMNLLRWVSARTIKERFVPPTNVEDEV